MTRCVRVGISLVFMIGVFLSVPAVSYANPLTASLDKTANNTTLGEENGNQSLADRFNEDPATYIGRILGIVLSMLGVMFFFLIFYAGILWMTAHGKEENVTKAQDIMVNATIGLIIVLGSYAIVRFVFQSIQSDDPPQTNERCLALGEGYSCQNINNCIDFAEGSTVAEKRNTCGITQTCELNLCPGGNDIVCCISL